VMVVLILSSFIIYGRKPMLAATSELVTQP
jgi:hypothetical protein